jgi:pimeloyl-ACP methyl ester carboxylesterase
VARLRFDSDRFVVSALRMAAGYRSCFTETRLGRLHHLDVRGAGARPTTVLLHGLSSNGAHYGRFIRPLRSAFRRLIALDLPGHGLSARLPSHAQLADLDLALVEAIERASDEPVVLFGNSLGGFAAIRYALNRPERVRALILASPAGAWMPPREHREFMARFHMRTHADALRFVDDVLAASPIARQLLAVGIRRRFSRPGMRRFLAMAGQADLLTPHELGRLSMPVLCLWGERDGVLPASSADFFRSHLPPHARFEVPRGLGHSPYLERPDAVARRLIGFVDATSESRASV